MRRPTPFVSCWLESSFTRIEVAPSGDGNDNATLHRFVGSVRRIAPDASGSPVFVIEAAATIVRAFLEAGRAFDRESFSQLRPYLSLAASPERLG
jgi:hypothetical protein